MATARTQRTSVVLLLLMEFASAAACHAADKWSVPAQSAPLAQLPRLTQAITVDGDLADWAGAVSVPVRHSSDICFAAYGYQWRGPADISMEAYCGWRPEGLCLATVVADDKVENLRTDDAIYLEDSIELYVDGRAPNKQATSPYTPGAYQIMITPPLPGREVTAIINGRDGDIQGLRVAGKETPTGYIIEALIPWGAFPELDPEPGAQIALNFAVNDYDGDDPKAERPSQLNRDGAQLMWEHPEGCIKWLLVDRVQTGETVAIDPAAKVELPLVAANGPVKLLADCGTHLSAKAGSVRFRILDAEARELLDGTVEVSPLPAPWAESVQAVLDWRPNRPGADGLAVVTAVVNDKQGRPLGFASQNLLLVAQTQADALARLKSADIAAVSQTDPFKAAQYLGVGSCYERLKRAVEIQERASAVQAARELPARLEVLDRRPVAAGSEGMTDLLNLAGDPEAQVVVEYPMYPPSVGRPDTAYITFYWGAVPLVPAIVFEYTTEEAAAKRLRAIPGWVFSEFAEATSLDGMPATVSTSHYVRRLLDLPDFAPEQQLTLVQQQSNLLRVVDAALLPQVQVDAVTILPGCPEPVRAKVTAWANETGRPVMGLEAGLEEGRLLIAGDVRAVAERLGKQATFLYWLRPGPTNLMVQAGRRVVYVTAPARDICDRVARLIIAGKPVPASVVDTVREEIVGQLAPRAAAPPTPAGFGLYCGDVHVHSFYSDGTPSPVGLWLEALHSYMDFAVLTDHDTLEGALVARKLLTDHGFSFPFIVGEEMSADWSDFGAYPLTTTILTSLPAYDMFKAAHVQGAVIQWNHPGGPFSDWAAFHLKNGIGDTSLDAWEHLPDSYDEWRKTGTLPVIVGSSDTHDGTFGWGERTIILAPTSQGDDLAEAIRSRHVAAVMPYTEFLCGPDSMLSLVWPDLAEGKTLKSGTAERLRSTLKKADLVGLLEASPPKPVSLKDLATD